MEFVYTARVQTSPLKCDVKVDDIITSKAQIAVISQIKLQ